MGNPASTSVFLIVTECDADTGTEFIQNQLLDTSTSYHHWVIVTRNKNKELLQWLSEFRKVKPDMFIEIFLVTCTRDLNEAVLKTKSIWNEHNIVKYPNRLEPSATIKFEKHQGEVLFQTKTFSQEGV